jgi:hypothetical protein
MPLERAPRGVDVVRIPPRVVGDGVIGIRGIEDGRLSDVEKTPLPLNRERG